MGSAAGGPRATTPGQQLRALFYVVPPGESSFRTLEEVPDYVEKSIPFFIAFIVLEFAVSWVQKRKLSGRINDGISSLSLGILSRLPDVLFRSVDLISYIYVWNNYRLFELPWDSPWTWYLTFLGVDFAYYWFHRISHATISVDLKRTETIQDSSYGNVPKPSVCWWKPVVLFGYSEEQNNILLLELIIA